jgi:type IV pilus assembly protein PilV
MRINKAEITRAPDGFVLLEALITVVLIAFGFIGLLGLQLGALKDTQTSRNLTQATISARDMADRLRYNHTVVAAYDFSLVPASASNCIATSSTCTEAQFFEAEYYSWLSATASRLNAGEAIVCRTTTPDSGTGVASPGCTGGSTEPLAIKVWWTEKDSSLSSKERFAMTFVGRNPTK